MNRQLPEERRSGMRGMWAEDGIRTVSKKHKVSGAQTEEEHCFLTYGSGAWTAEERSDMKEQWATIVR